MPYIRRKSPSQQPEMANEEGFRKSMSCCCRSYDYLCPTRTPKDMFIKLLVIVLLMIGTFAVPHHQVNSKNSWIALTMISTFMCMMEVFLSRYRRAHHARLASSAVHKQ